MYMYLSLCPLNALTSCQRDKAQHVQLAEVARASQAEAPPSPKRFVQDSDLSRQLDTVPLGYGQIFKFSVDVHYVSFLLSTTEQHQRSVV